MGQEFFIKSSNLENKVRQLLPSQGGLGAGQDLSASTQIVPIVDLTESAEGSNFRADLQSALSFNSATTFSVNTTETTLISNTGYYRVTGSAAGVSSSSTTYTGKFNIKDVNLTSKTLYNYIIQASTSIQPVFFPFDFIVFMTAGDTFTAVTSVNTFSFQGSTRQLADIDGNLVNP